MWQKSKLSLVLLLVLFFSFSAYLSAEPADISKAELSAIFQTLDDLQKENVNLTSDYTELITTYQQSLTTHERKLMDLQQKVKLMEIESQVRSEALQKLEKETVWTKIGLFLTGSVFGYGANELKNDIMSFSR